MLCKECDEPLDTDGVTLNGPVHSACCEHENVETDEPPYGRRDVGVCLDCLSDVADFGEGWEFVN